MSFSGKVKEELEVQDHGARHCRLAEISAIVDFCGRYGEDREGIINCQVYTENIHAARKCFTLMEKAFNIKADMQVRMHSGKGAARFRLLWRAGSLKAVKGVMVQGTCCKRAYVRGAFLASGSMSDPEKAYHWEIVCRDRKQAGCMAEMLKAFSLNAKIVQRKKSFVVYLKEAEQIADVLKIMEAHVALMEFENVRIFKDMRNSVNRKVNCETANIKKTISASVKQIEDIELIRNTIGLEDLPGLLREAAEARLSYPEANLLELAGAMDTPVGKSGMNHRYRRIAEIADTIRKQQGGWK